jgi:hypothetical protein
VSVSECFLNQANLADQVPDSDRYDTEVGYTQGVAFVVASLLLNMPDEEAFCVLVRLMDSVGSFCTHARHKQ